MTGTTSTKPAKKASEKAQPRPIRPTRTTTAIISRGPRPSLDCSACHDTTYMPFFRSGTDSDNDGRYNLAETDVCNTCHSLGGDYNVVKSDPAKGSIGAKDNWYTGVYTNDGGLPGGKEKWCAGCHDKYPSIISSVSAPKVIGDETFYDPSEYPYGTGYGNYKTGHGLAADEAYPYKGGLIPPSLVNGAGRPVNCDSCHDLSAGHIVCRTARIRTAQ